MKGSPNSGVTPPSSGSKRRTVRLGVMKTDAHVDLSLPERELKKLSKWNDMEVDGPRKKATPSKYTSDEEVEEPSLSSEVKIANGEGRGAQNSTPPQASTTNSSSRPNSHKKQKESADASSSSGGKRKYTYRPYLHDDDKWYEMFDRLKKHLRERNCKKFPERIFGDRELADWVQKQRQDKMKDFLSKEHFRLLDALGFLWLTEYQRKFEDASKEDRWMMQYRELVKFYKEFGHTR